MKTRVGGRRVMRELLVVGLTVVSKPLNISRFYRWLTNTKSSTTFHLRGSVVLSLVG